MRIFLALLFSVVYSMAHSSDLDIFLLKGPVDSVCVTFNDAGLEWQTEFTFDVDGNLIEIDGGEFDSTRDSSGRLKTLTIEYPAEDDESVINAITLVVKYDSEGRVTAVESLTPDDPLKRKYFYDKDGRLQRVEEENPDYTESMTYTYLKFDSYGNWIERREKLGSMDQTIMQKREVFYGE